MGLDQQSRRSRHRHNPDQDGQDSVINDDQNDQDTVISPDQDGQSAVICTQDDNDTSRPIHKV